MGHANESGRRRCGHRCCRARSDRSISTGLRRPCKHGRRTCLAQSSSVHSKGGRPSYTSVSPAAGILSSCSLVTCPPVCACTVQWSSRGFTQWEYPYGAGRAGVDVITHGEFWGADQHNSCQHQWGTSVACPVVVGALALLLSSIPERDGQRERLLNPAALKQVIYAGARRMANYSWLEQACAPSASCRSNSLWTGMVY
eukprot:scaffold271879_cov30-Tisochrysis_lutea.AAC.3